MVLEICVDSVESAGAAQRGGAQRIELCSALSVGGLTPSAGLVAAVREELSIPIFAMVRPRAGDFYYSADEFALMRRELLETKKQGIDGVVLGLLHQDGKIDVERTRELVEVARPLEVTFHRAIDWTPLIEEALEQVIATGADRVLTSGGRQSAMLGVENLTRLVARSGGRIRVMVCGRVRKDNVVQLARRTKAAEFHASLRKKIESPVTYKNDGLHMGEPGTDEFARYAVSAEDVKALSDALHRVEQDSLS